MPPTTPSHTVSANKVALLLAATTMLCGITLLHLYVSQLEARATGGVMVPVVAAARDAPTGTTIERAMLGMRDLPQAYIESRHIRARDLDSLVGTRLKIPMRAGEALLASDVIGMLTQARSLSSLISAGMRAFTLRAEHEAFAQMLDPGDRVDVLLVGTERSSSLGNDAARTLLEGVLVLAVDGQTADHDAARTRSDGGVTLAVTGEQGLVLASAERTGALRLLLRNPDEVVPVTGAVP